MDTGRGLATTTPERLRVAPNHSACRNNLRDIARAAQTVHDAHGTLPPGVGWFPEDSAYGPAFFHLLAHLGQEDTYRAANGPGGCFVGNGDTRTRPVKVYVCPSDPSVGPDGRAADDLGVPWGASSYGGNGQVFAEVDSAGWFVSSNGQARLPDSFSDGTANTLLFAEKYARCTNANFPEGGSFWAYWVVGPRSQPLHASFVVAWTAYSFGPPSRFQHRPRPHLGNCDPTLASTPHPAGMNVALADGSVRTLSPAMSGPTWWAACTPAGHDTLGPDW